MRHPELVPSSKVKVFLVKVGALGTVRFRKADRPPPPWGGQAKGTDVPAGPEANFTSVRHSGHKS